MQPATLALAEHLIRLLHQNSWTVSLGESCTGGLLGAYVTATPGASAVFTHGFVCYSNYAKLDILGVEQAVMDTHGAVSEPVAVQMAEGAAAAARTDVGLGLTGIAGPGGGTALKPAGLIFGAVSVRGSVQSRQWTLDGNRTTIREEAVKSLLTFAAHVATTSEKFRRR